MRILQFSGGKDSLALLHLYKKEWDNILVMWMNTGDAYPETLAQMKDVAAMVPNFLEIKADVRTDIAKNGFPVDVVVMNHTALGKLFIPSRAPKVRAVFDCCANNLWAPLHNACKRLGATEIIRGQMNVEKYKSDIRSGHVEDGITYTFPLQEWTKADVDAFLHKEGVAMPAHYKLSKTSLDCMRCTAYLDARQGQLQYLKKAHPHVHAETISILRAISGEIENELAPMREVLADATKHG